ncbi:MAG: 50S ribosomal protein L31e [Nanoarchaeota archaeon]|nr:50S ribosomal protein L31e [Nanoarchaeota archaeon]
MDKDNKQEKTELEREYIVPLRKKFLRTPKHKRIPKAIKALKKFIARHMKLRDDDLRKIKIDKYLNEEIWFRGIRNPPSKIKVKVKKLESGDIQVELAEMPLKLKYKKEREEKHKEEKEKKKEKKVEEKKKEIKEEAKPEEEKKEEEEKEKSSVESSLRQSEQKHKELKHQAQVEKGPKHQIRKALKK